MIDRIRELHGRYDRIVEVAKFNPYHGKDGRFTSAPSVGMGVGGAAAGGVRTVMEGTLRDAEKANLTLDHEVATIVNPRTGKMIFSKEGSADGISFNSSEVREIAGQVLTHNHPDAVIFSPADVAMAYHVDTIRATNPDGTVYELGGLRRREVVRDYQNHYMEARAQSFRDLGIAEDTRDRELQGEQRTGSFSAISESCHKWLTDNAEKYGYRYSKGRVE